MLTKSTSTPLADIRAAKLAIFQENAAGRPNLSHYYYKLVPRERELQQQAYAEFARLNGWRASFSEFSLEQLAGRVPDFPWQEYRRDVFDHSIFFRLNRQPIALATQPYPGKCFCCIDEAREIAERLGLALHIPPVEMASIHLPSGCLFMVFTSRDHKIRFLPEQLIAGVGGDRVKRGSDHWEDCCMSQSAPNPNTSLAERIAIALGGVEREDRPGSWKACCPAHDDDKPSLSITDGDGGRPLLWCFAGCEYEDIRATLEARGILGEGWQDRLPPATPRPPPKPPEQNPKAFKLWHDAWVPKAGGVVDRYLKGRGLMLSIPASLRETTRLVVKVEGKWRELPAMLAAIQIPVEGETFGKIITVQRTLLKVRRHDESVYRGERLNASWPLGNGAVRLGKAGDILGIAEGVETALSAMQLTGIPVWACLGSWRMPRVAIPESVRELHIFGDDDGSGHEAAEKTAEVHADRKVVLRFPPKGFPDWNDALNGYYAPKGLNYREAIAEYVEGAT